VNGNTNSVLQFITGKISSFDSVQDLLCLDPCTHV